MYKMREELQRLMKIYHGSFINENNELILIPKRNLYFILYNVKNEDELKCKLLEYVSRSASNASLKHGSKKDIDYATMNRNNINEYLGTDFTHNDMRLIYSQVGGGTNRDLCMRFVKSNYDMDVIYDKEFMKWIEKE